MRLIGCLRRSCLQGSLRSGGPMEIGRLRSRGFRLLNASRRTAASIYPFPCVFWVGQGWNHTGLGAILYPFHVIKYLIPLLYVGHLNDNLHELVSVFLEAWTSAHKYHDLSSAPHHIIQILPLYTLCLPHYIPTSNSPSSLFPTGHTSSLLLINLAAPSFLGFTLTRYGSG